jgi:integrase
MREAQKWRESPALFQTTACAETMTFEVLVDLFLERKKSKVRPSTIEAYRNCIRHLGFFNQLPVRQINATAIDGWLNVIKGERYLAGCRDNRITYEHELGLLSQILGHYAEYIDDEYQVPVKKRHHDDAIIDRTRYLQAKERNRARYIPREDFARLLDLLRERARSDIDRLCYVAALMQLRTGLRIGEVCALDIRDVDFSTGAIRVGKTVHWARRRGSTTTVFPMTKTGVSRIIWATEDLLHELALLRARLGEGRTAGLLFSEDNGFTPIKYRQIQHRYNRALRHLGFPWRSTHILRHSFATDFIEVTGDTVGAKGILGHKGIQQTEHYAKTTEKRMRQGFQQYSSSLSPGEAKVVSIDPSGCVGLGESAQPTAGSG